MAARLFTSTRLAKSVRFLNEKIRHLMLLYEPQLQYDLIKGIEPFRDSYNYLSTVNELKILLEKHRKNFLPNLVLQLHITINIYTPIF